jgi:hypothetical protein
LVVALQVEFSRYSEVIQVAKKAVMASEVKEVLMQWEHQTRYNCVKLLCTEKGKDYQSILKRTFSSFDTARQDSALYVPKAGWASGGVESNRPYSRGCLRHKTLTTQSAYKRECLQQRKFTTQDAYRTRLLQRRMFTGHHGYSSSSSRSRSRARFCRGKTTSNIKKFTSVQRSTCVG